MFKHFIENQINSILSKDVRMQIKKVTICSLNTIRIHNSLILYKDENVATFDFVDITFSIERILQFSKKPVKIFVKELHCQINKTIKSNLVSEKKDKTSIPFFYSIIDRMLNQIFSQDTVIEIRDSSFCYDGKKIAINYFLFSKSALNYRIFYKTLELTIKSSLNALERSIDVYDSMVKTETFSFEFSGRIKDRKEGAHILESTLSFSNIQISNSKVCEKSIYIEEVDLQTKVIASEKNLEIKKLDTSIEGFAGSMILNYDFITQQLFLTIGTKIEANNCCFLKKVFSNSFQTLTFTGQVDLYFSIALDLTLLDKCEVKLIVDNDTLEFTNFGCFEALRLTDYKYFLKKDNLYIRIFNCSPTNQSFLKFEQIPEILVKLIIFCEDPRFYLHKGVDPLFMNFAIARDLKARKFQAGGSTITMQLTKNLFLNGKKNLIRKFEEVLYSLLVENKLKIPKNKILEIYFNVIEFGPNIYGLSEGTAYYFGKKIYDLTISEFIILTYIIKKPLFFNDALLMQSEQLSKNLKEYFDIISHKLLRFNIISEEQFKNLDNKIQFNGDLGRILLK